MSMSSCDMCNDLVDTDYDCGEWDIEDKEGNYYDFVCESCVADSEELVISEDL